MSLAARITGAIPSELFDWLKTHGLMYVVREFGEKCGEHYHLLIHANANTIRTKFKRAWNREEYDGQLPGKGNAKWSIKKCDDEAGYKRYMSKGASKDEQPDVVYSVGIDSAMYHEDYWKINAELSAKSTRKRKAATIMDEIWGDLREDIGFSTDGTLIAAKILRWYLSKGLRVPNEFSMKTMTMTFVCRVNDSMSGCDKLSDVELIRRLYPSVSF